MIRINLLKPLQTPDPAERVAELVKEPPATGRIAIFSLLLLAAVGAGLYYAIQNSRSNPKKEEPVVVAQPAPPAAAPPQPVKPVVKNTMDTVQALTADPVFHLLKDLLAATTPGVGYSRIEFASPGEFHVHGVASTEKDLKDFQSALGTTTGIELKEDRVVPVGADKAAREFFFSGEAHYPVAKGDSGVRTLALNQLNEALQDFASAAKEQNIDLEKPALKDSSLFRGNHSFHYSANARCDYSDLQTLLGKMQKIRSCMGFQHLTLEARGEEKMAASFALVLYAR